MDILNLTSYTAQHLTEAEDLKDGECDFKLIEQPALKQLFQRIDGLATPDSITCAQWLKAYEAIYTGHRLPVLIDISGPGAIIKASDVCPELAAAGLQVYQAGYCIRMPPIVPTPKLPWPLGKKQHPGPKRVFVVQRYQDLK